MSSMVQCPSCGLAIKLRERIYGRKVECKCGAVLRMPTSDAAAAGGDASAAPAPPPLASSNPGAKTLSGLGTPPPTIRFQCPTCQQLLEVQGEFAGKVSKCTCGTHIRVPEESIQAAPSMPDPLAPDPYGMPSAASGFSGAPSNDLFGDDPLMNASSLEGASLGKPAYLQSRPKPPPAPKKKKKKSRRKAESESEGSASAEIGGGILMMVGAVVWFVVGLANDVIFFYPPILFFLGLAGIVKGLMKL